MVRWILAVIVILIVGICICIFLNNKMPKGLGLTEGILKECPSSPNCVSSQVSSDDSTHYAAPIIYSGERKDTQLLIESYFLNQGNARIVSSSLGYVHLEIKSKSIGFVDDLELYFPESNSFATNSPENSKVVHFRSASRVGYSDRGVNRARIEEIYNLLMP